MAARSRPPASARAPGCPRRARPSPCRAPRARPWRARRPCPAPWRPSRFFSRRFSTVSRSLRHSSVSTTSLSPRGSTLPSTWMTLSSSKQRSTCSTASTWRMLARNWLPRPSPFDAPRTRPAMSTNSSVVGIVFFGWKSAASCVQPLVRHRHDADVRLDGAERVVGRLGRAWPSSALKRVDLPTLGRPTIPMERPMVSDSLREKAKLRRTGVRGASRGLPPGSGPPGGRSLMYSLDELTLRLLVQARTSDARGDLDGQVGHLGAQLGDGLRLLVLDALRAPRPRGRRPPCGPGP